MSVKLASALALALSSPALVSATKPTIHLHYPLVHQVDCSNSRGTAFRIGPTKFLSVAHVTDGKNCTIDGLPFTAVQDEGLDFSVVTVPTKRGGAIRINCGGFKRGEYYYATGYAHGRPWQQTVILYSYGQTDNGLARLWGSPTVIPGMSGGPVMNTAGEVVGMVNAYSPWLPFSWSQPLSDTSVCKGAAVV